MLLYSFFLLVFSYISSSSSSVDFLSLSLFHSFPLKKTGTWGCCKAVSGVAASLGELPALDSIRRIKFVNEDSKEATTFILTR